MVLPLPPQKKKSLEFYEITGNQSFTIPDVKDSGDVIDGVVIMYYLEIWRRKKQAVYLIQLTNHTWKKMNIPRKLRNDMEIHLVKTQKKILITNKKRAYLVDVECAVNRYGQRHKKKTHCNGKQCVFILKCFFTSCVGLFSHR